VYVNKAKVTQLGLAQAGTNNKQNSFLDISLALFVWMKPTQLNAMLEFGVIMYPDYDSEFLMTAVWKYKNAYYFKEIWPFGTESFL
jgi:hypothetical protein